MPTDDLCEVVITAPDPEWLAAFTRRLIEDHLCAGSHQIETVRSIYPWKGEIHDTQEARVALRTRNALIDAIIERVRAEHPYDVPSVVAFALIATSAEYGDWIRESTAHRPT